MWTLSLLSLIGILVVPSTASLTPEEFAELIEPMCFKNEDNADALLVNGQEVPLASTLENFISLVEKIELASSTMTIEEELFYLLRNFVYENIDFNAKGKISNYKPTSVDYTEVNKFWEREDAKRVRQPVEIDVLSNQEMCSLFFMLSHTIMKQAMKVDKKDGPRVDRVYVNTTFSGPARSDGGSMDNLYPCEQGVVAVRGSNQAVALSRVIMGLYVGLRNENERRIPFNSLKTVKDIYKPAADQVDPLVILTLAEPLIIAQWPYEQDKRDELAKNGVWKASPSTKTIHDTVEVCPSVYKLDELEKSMYSYSTVRGAADGLILGQIISDLVSQRSNIRLSQILRMYYSSRGIRTLQGNGREAGTVSFCARRQLIDSLESTLQEQMELFALLVGPLPSEAKETVKDAWDYYFGLKTDIYGDRRVTDELCPVAVDPKDPEKKYPLETPMDFLVVLDSKNSITTQQLIVGHLANHLELRSGGGTMTVLLDQREGTTGLKLRPIVNETFNVACAACMVTQLVDGVAAADRDIVIQAIDEYLQNQKKTEVNQNGVKGKIVVYFNLLDDEKENYRLSKALRSFHLSHQDVSVYAVGKETEVLKKYSKSGLHHILSTADQPADVAKNLFDKLVKDPAILQYTDCKNARSESGATFEEFVSPNSVQHWAMPAKYFHKSFDIKFTFEAEYGNLQACYSRASSSPENQLKNCQSTTGTDKKIEFKDTNPCSGFNEITCEPLYFSVMGLNASENSPSNQFCQDTQNAKCKSLDQVKFKVTHNGIRCSGTIGLLSSPILMVLAFLILQILTKKY